MRNDLYVTIFDGSDIYTVANLADYGKDVVTFGRLSEDNDLALGSRLVSKQHGCFEYADGSWRITDRGSTNGLFWNGHRIDSKKLASGDRILIGYEETHNKVAMIFSAQSPRNRYEKLDLRGSGMVIIGRDIGCDVCVDHPAVYRQHCKLLSDRDGCWLEKIAADGVLQYNGSDVSARRRLADMDRFVVGDVQFIYQNHFLYYIRMPEGLSFDVSHLSKTVGRGRTRKKINDDITFSVEAGEFVAIIGGSGAGKSTLLNCLCGSSSITDGNVYINGDSLTENYAGLKNLIGYVPQQDIVYDNLTLENMLHYTARLRMPSDSTREELDRRIRRALDLVELSDRAEVLIRNLSGGQKKRASIAVELLADPKLFFLDEPTSGLDPGTERSLMLTLKEMARQGKTVVLVTHTPLNLHMCDKIVVLGRGGKLCYCGSPAKAAAHFGVRELVDIYEIINHDPEPWAVRCKEGLDRGVTYAGAIRSTADQAEKLRNRTSQLRQLRYLVVRYLDLMVHDARRIFIQLCMAPGLGLLLYLAFSSSYPFQAAYDTQKLALTLACCAFWIGLFNSIQEICKEKQIYRRERMANLRLLPYVSSKLLVNALLDLVQTALLLAVVYKTLGMPEAGMQLQAHPVLEIAITTYLTMLSATCLGFVVSALVENPDQAISAAPILLIPQILFSGIIVELEGMIDQISYLFSCRYACTAYCTTANINDLPSEFKLTALGMEEGETVIISSAYSYDSSVFSMLEGVLSEDALAKLSNPIAFGWIALAVLSLAALTATAVILKIKSKRK